MLIENTVPSLLLTWHTADPGWWPGNLTYLPQQSVPNPHTSSSPSYILFLHRESGWTKIQWFNNYKHSNVQNQTAPGNHVDSSMQYLWLPNLHQTNTSACVALQICIRLSDSRFVNSMSWGNWVPWVPILWNFDWNRPTNTCRIIVTTTWYGINGVLKIYLLTRRLHLSSWNN